MRRPIPIVDIVSRGGVATLMACVVVSLTIAIQHRPDSAAVLDTPFAAEALLLQAIGSFLLMLVLHIPWVLPVCIAVQWVLSSRHVRGVASSSLIGLLVAAAVLGSLFIASSRSPQIMTPVALQCAAFAAVWFTFYEWLSPSTSPVNPTTQPSAGSAEEVVARAGFEVLAIAGALVWTTIFGFVFAMASGSGVD
jgi:hypothetical protein